MSLSRRDLMMAAAALPIVGLPTAIKAQPAVPLSLSTLRLLGALARVAIPALSVDDNEDRRHAEAMYFVFCNAAGVPDHHRQWIDELYVEVMGATPGAVVVG